MTKSAGMALAAVLAMGFGHSASAQTVGDWVLGNYRNSGYWFAGVIGGIKGDTITVRYDDGETEQLPLARVRPYDWMIGTRVECNFKAAGTWYPGKITSLAGERIGIAYDDGDTETTKTGRCRTK